MAAVCMTRGGVSRPVEGRRDNTPKEGTNVRRPTGRLLTSLLALHLTAGLSAAQVAGQKAHAQRTQPIARIVYEGEMAPLLAKLAQEFGVNIGVEVDPPQPRTTVKIDLKDPTLQDVLDAVVKSAPRYQWRATDGALEVSPVRGGSALLESPVAAFRVSDVDQAEAVDLLMNLPEVRANMAAMNLQYRRAVAAKAGGGGEKFSLNLEGVSLRQALHKIAERGGRFWAFRRYGSGPDGEFIAVDTTDR